MEVSATVDSGLAITISSSNRRLVANGCHKSWPCDVTSIYASNTRKLKSDFSLVNCETKSASLFYLI